MSDRNLHDAAPTAAPRSNPETRRRARKVAIAGGVGTLIEYYDFSLYGYVALVVAPQFFPNDDPVVSLLAALTVFGTAYLMRPLGGIIFGHVGDRFGRKTALLATLVCMGIGSFAMGILPTFAQVGVWAAVLLVLARLIQGFSAGGEVGGSATFISEASPAHKRGWYGSFTPLGSTAGFALAAAVAGTTSALTTPEQFAEWGWRIPFLLAVPLTIFCLWIRTQVEETIDAEVAAGTVTMAATPRVKTPVLRVFVEQPLALVQATAISAACNGTAYIGLSYMTIHLVQRLGYGQTEAYWVTTVVILIAALLMPVGGRLADRIGFVNVTLVGLIGFAVLTYPAMLVMDGGIVVAAVAFFVIMVNTVGTQVGSYTILPRLFNPEVRYTGVAMGWNLGVVVAGGTAPATAVWLIQITGNVVAPAFFVIVAAVIGIVAVLSVKTPVDASRRDSCRRRSLRRLEQGHTRLRLADHR